MRIAARRDDTEASIVDALRQAGVQVWRLSQPGVPDLLCAYRGAYVTVECKSPGGKLKGGQRDFIDAAAQQGCKVIVAYTAEDALRGIGAIP